MNNSRTRRLAFGVLAARSPSEAGLRKGWAL